MATPRQLRNALVALEKAEAQVAIARERIASLLENDLRPAMPKGWKPSMKITLAEKKPAPKRKTKSPVIGHGMGPDGKQKRRKS